MFNNDCVGDIYVLPTRCVIWVAGGGGSRTGAGGVLGSVGHPVAQIEVGPSHFAFLLEDGRICR